MTALAEDVSNSLRHNVSKDSEKNGASLTQEGFFSCGRAHKSVTLLGNAVDLLGMRHCQPAALARADGVLNGRFRRTHNSKGTQHEVHRHQQNQPCTYHCRYQRRTLPFLRPCLQEWADRKCAGSKRSLDRSLVRSIHNSTHTIL